MPILQLAGNGVVGEGRLRGFGDIRTGGSQLGERLRRNRLAGLDDPDPHLQPHIYALEIWGRIVEEYSMTAITNGTDKLIALSGIARSMSQGIEKPPKKTIKHVYVAGLWMRHIASQLLWLVEPVFRESSITFEHLSTAPETYRAPSFSWAAVDAHGGRGIKYAEVTDQDLFIEVGDVDIIPQEGSDDFGLLKDAYLILHGKLRKAVISANPTKEGRFSWRLEDREERQLNQGEHRNVYLDCPKRDQGSILGRDADIFVVPAAKGARLASEESKYLICLLLQLNKTSGRKYAFQRIGLTKLSP